MRRFWKRDDEVKPFRPPPSLQSPPSSQAAQAYPQGRFIGDNYGDAAAPAAGGGAVHWASREADGRCEWQRFLRQLTCNSRLHARSPNISRPLGAIVRRTSQQPLTVKASARRIYNSLSVVISSLQAQPLFHPPSTPPSPSPLSPSALPSAPHHSSPKLKFYKTAASSPSSALPVTQSSLAHLQRSASDVVPASASHASSPHAPLPRSASERTGLKPAVPVVPVSSLPPPLSVLCGTWNMHGKPPPPFFPGFADSDATHDVYCFGTQEAGSGIVMSFVNPSKEAWESRLMATLGPFYVMVASKTMQVPAPLPCAALSQALHAAQAIHIAVFVRASIARSLSNVRVARVPTGLLGIVGNKGGVAVSFELHKKSFLFVSAHFAAHQEQVRTEAK